MKLAFSTLGCPEWTFERALEQASAMGYDAIEIRGIGGEMRVEKLAFLKAENRAKTGELLAARGLSICSLDTSVKFDSSMDREEALAEGRAAMDLCADMGIPAIRVFGDMLLKPLEQSVDLIASGIAQLCEHDRRVNVLLETHGDYNTQETLGPVIGALKGHANFGILWDVAHTDRAYGDDYLPVYRMMRPYIRHMHIKDHRRAGMELCLCGEGDIPIPKIVRTLREDGYSGVFSLEWEKRWHAELAQPEEAFPAYVAYMRGL